jgi:hypothetical protein
MQLNGSRALDLLVGLRETATGSSSVGTLYGAHVDLIGSNSVGLGRDVSWGSVSAALSSYPGYAQASLTWNLPSLAMAGGVEVVSDAAEYRPTGSDSLSVAYGLILRQTGNDTTVLMAGTFDAPIPMGSSLDYLQLNVRYSPVTGGSAQILS